MFHRLMFVNDVNLENASLDEAVQVLKSIPKGKVVIGIAKPLTPDAGGANDSLDFPRLDKDLEPPPETNGYDADLMMPPIPIVPPPYGEFADDEDDVVPSEPAPEPGSKVSVARID